MHEYNNQNTNNLMVTSVICLQVKTLVDQGGCKMLLILMYKEHACE